MALTRNMLKAMSIEDEKIEQIIDAHSETVDALKKQRDSYKVEAEKVPELEAQIKNADSGEDYREKYEAEKQAFEEFKAEIEERESLKELEGKYKELLKEAGVDEKRISAILKVTDLQDLELNKDGSLKGSDKLKEAITDEWAAFIVHTDERGADVDNPPDNKGGKMTKDQILGIKDAAERQAAIAENHELFGF